jgi:hypothetical protein
MFVYRVKTKLTKEESEDIYDNLSPLEIETLESYNLIAYDVEEKGTVTSYMITSRYILTRIILFLRQKDIEFEFEDITEDVLIGKISFKGTFFDEDIIEYIDKNITTDHLLDKINHFGIESLSPEDMKKLKSLSK